MARERIENGSTTSLNGTINDSTTTVAVSDASVFSPLPQFRIIIDSEIMLVTAIAGNNLTVTRGAESSLAAAHTDGAVCAQIITREGIRRMMRDWCNPFYDDPSAIPMQLLDDAGAALTGADFTDINFGGSGTTTKTDMSQGSILLEKGAQGASNSYGLMVKSAPSPPWVHTIAQIPNLMNVTASDFTSCNHVVRDSGTGEFISILQSTTSGSSRRLGAFKFASPTSSSTSFLPGDKYWGGWGVQWTQIEDDNVDLIFRFSADGVNFIELGREARLTFLTPDQIGVGLNNFGNPGIIQTTLVAWDES